MNRSALLPVVALFTAALPVEAASGCDALIAAVLKVLQVPSHLYITQTAGFTGGKPKSVETIYLNNVTYTMVNGQWRKSPLSTKELADERRQSDQKISQCTLVREEAVNGEPATLYRAHSQTPDNTVDTQIWISKLRALPLKQISDIDIGGEGGKSRTEIRYEYTNVTAPAVVDPKRK